MTRSGFSAGVARRADALRYITELFLAHHGEATGAGSSADRVQVVVHIDQAILAEQQAAASEPHRCELEDGPALALDTARRLSCDCTIVGIVEGEDGERSTSGARLAAFPPRLHAPSGRATAGAVSLAAIARAFARGTTSNTGPTAGKRSSTT
jgi:hypothetical protein